MLKSLMLRGGPVAALFIMPVSARAMVEKAEELVVVADTRVLSGVSRYFANLYNNDIWAFAMWSVVLTATLGVFLGLVMDFIMMRTGIDLRSRNLAEH